MFKLIGTFCNRNFIVWTRVLQGPEF